MSWLKELGIFLFVFNPMLSVFLGTLLLGEDALLIFAILSGKGIIPLWMILALGLPAVMISDSIYYLVGKTKVFAKIKKTKHGGKMESAIEHLCRLLGKKRIILILSISKFVYGFRLLMLFHLSSRGMKYLKYIKYDLVATLVWAVIMIPLAWLVGRGFGLFFDVAKDIEKTLGIVFIIFLVYYLFMRGMSSYVIRKINKRFNSIKDKLGNGEY